MEETTNVLNTTEFEEPAKHELEDKTILIPVLPEDFTEEAVKVLEETPKVLNTAKLEETTEPEETTETEETAEDTTKLEKTGPAEHEVEGEAALILRTPDSRAVPPEDTTEEAVVLVVSSESLPLVVELNQTQPRRSCPRRSPRTGWRRFSRFWRRTPRAGARDSPNSPGSPRSLPPARPGRRGRPTRPLRAPW